MLLPTAPTLLLASRAPVSTDMDSTVSHRKANIIVIRSGYSRTWVGRPVPMCVCVCVCVCVHAVLARSCSELYTGGLRDNANVEIDTDGPDGPAQPFTAYCEINGATAYTIIRRSSVTCRVLLSRIYALDTTVLQLQTFLRSCRV